jgi:hypothetical protein
MKSKTIICIAVGVFLLGSVIVGFSTGSVPVTEMQPVYDRTQEKLDRIINRVDEIHEKIQEYHGDK